MAPIGKLTGFAGNSRVRRVLAAAALAGVELDFDKNFSMKDGKYKTKEWLAKFPAGTLPTFEGADGLLLSESAAIAEYVAGLGANSTLIPTDKGDAARVHQYQAFADQEIFVPASLTNGILAGRIPYNKSTFSSLLDRVMARLTALNTDLSDKTFLVGERITLADIFIATALVNAFTSLIDAPLRAKVPHLVRYTLSIINHPKLATIFDNGNVQFIETQPTYQPPAKEKAPKEKAPKAAEAAPKPPKAPKAAKPKEPEPEDEEDSLVPEEPKVKNPLDDLPKSAFNLEEWKRQYSNLDTRKEALPWFYEKFDHDGFSIWKVDFKYNEELTQVFMSSNQVGGFFNRLEASRKYLFGSVGVCGKANDSLITGVLVLRGKEFQPVVSVAPDWESYDYAPLDLTKEDDKSFFEGAMAWDLVYNGKEWADGKNFK
ncbi:elongation factor 1-gamma, partial [Tremellales sp. Uapishka_1]